MADLTLRINADFEKAQQAFTELANKSEETKQKMEKYSDSFKDKNIDDFINKQKLLTASLTGTRGEVDAMKAASNNYKKEIERLIKSGLEPNHEAIIKLRQEQERLENQVKRLNEVNKAKEQQLKNIEKAAKATWVALAAGLTAMAALVSRTAKLGDELTKTGRVVGMTAETLQELQYAANQSGVSDLTPILERLNRGMGDLQAGTGTLNNYLKDNNTVLLEQLKNVQSNEDAFNLLMDAIRQAPTEFERAQIATAAFGRAGQDLINMALQGSEGIAELREEARRFGIISNEAAANAELFGDAQSRLQASLQGVQFQITAGLLPGLTEAIDGVTNFISGIDDWDKILKVVGTSLLTAAAGLTTFVVVSKGHLIVTQMAVALKGLMAAVSGPAGIASLAVMGLVAAISALVAIEERQRRAVIENARAINENSQMALRLLDAYSGTDGLNSAKTLDKDITEQLIRLYPELTDLIKENETTVTEAATAIREYNESQIRAEAQPFIDNIIELTSELEQQRAELERLQNQYTKWPSWIRWLIESQDMVLKHTRENVNSLESRLRRFTNDANEILSNIGYEVGVGEYFGEIVRSAEGALEDLREIEENHQRERQNTFNRRLNELELTEQQHFNEMVSQARTYLRQRADLDRTSGEDRIASYQAELERIRQSQEFNDNELLAAERAVAEAIQEIRSSVNEIEIEPIEITINSGEALADMIAFLDSLNDIAETGGDSLQSTLYEKLTSWNAIQRTLFQENLDDATRYFLEYASRQSGSLDERLEAMREHYESMTEIRDNGLRRLIQAMEEAIEIEDYLNARAEVEQYARTDSHLQRQLDLYLEFYDQRTEMMLGFFNAQNEMERLAAENSARTSREMIQQFYNGIEAAANASAQLMGSYSSLLSEIFYASGENNKTLFGMTKALAHAEAGINTALAATKALASAPPPINAMLMAGVIASGVAQQMKIARTMQPPSTSNFKSNNQNNFSVVGRLNLAETGGRFIVPQSTGVDNSYMRLNPDEVVDVTPRSMVGVGENFNFNLIVDGQVFASIVNKQARAGELYTLQLASNY